MTTKSLKFYIKSDNYFGTLVAILSLIRQNIEKDENKKLNIKMFREIEKDSVYLQNSYSII